jgi:hypothetical protein
MAGREHRNKSSAIHTRSMEIPVNLRTVPRTVPTIRRRCFTAQTATLRCFAPVLRRTL